MKDAVFSLLAGRHQRVNGKEKREISAREEGEKETPTRNDLVCLIISPFPPRQMPACVGCLSFLPFVAWANSCEKHLSKPMSKLSERPPLGLRFLAS